MVERAGELAPVLMAEAATGEAERRLPARVVGALTDAGFMRLCVPRRYGGPEVDPITLVSVIEELARADGAAGWCAMIAATTSSMASFLPESAAREIYADPRVVTGGVFAPNGTGRAITRDGVDGFEVDGRWSWGSGTQHCDWILGGTRCDDDTFRLCWFPRSDITFHDTWFSSGMRGSGSLDFSVSGAWVPAERTIRPGETRPVVDVALARFPNMALLAAAVAAVGLGVARHALDELLRLAGDRRPQFSRRTLAQNGFVQAELAADEARWRAARALLHAELAATWQLAVDGDTIGLDERAGIRLAAVHAASTAVAVADSAYTLAGGAAVYETSPLGRCSRDAHVVTQHIQTAPKLRETIGRVLLGLEIDSSMF